MNATFEQAVATLRARARMMNADEVMGTDLITVEISGYDDDVILTQESAIYLHDKLADLIGRSCATDLIEEPA